MLKKNVLVVSLLSVFCISGCSSLGTMKETIYVEKPANSMGLINIVRPAIFLGDGVKFETWDGATFIGTLKAGTMLQYAATPGIHCIMVDPTQGGGWGVAKVDVKPGSTTFIKPNTAPFVGLILGVADENDPRKAEWAKSLTPLVIDTARTKPIPEKAKNRAKEFSVKCM